MKFGKNSRELRVLQERKMDLENSRRVLAGLDADLNRDVVRNNQAFEENRGFMEEVVKHG